MDTFPEGVVHVHFSNEVARRKRAYRGELLRNYGTTRYQLGLQKNKKKVVKEVQDRVDRILTALEQKKKDHRLILGIGLEDNFRNGGELDYKKAVKNLIKMTREVWPYEISRNPVDIRQRDLNFGKQHIDFIELHSCRPILGSRNIWNNDGCDLDYGQSRPLPNHISDEQMLANLRRERDNPGLRLLWIGEEQGLLVSNSINAPRPRRRSCVVTPKGVRVKNSILKQSL
jgi:hypothetical protein